MPTTIEPRHLFIAAAIKTTDREVLIRCRLNSDHDRYFYAKKARKHVHLTECTPRGPVDPSASMTPQGRKKLRDALIANTVIIHAL